MTKTIKQALFPCGQLVVTSNCMIWAAEHKVNLDDYLARHLTGDWGDIDEQDRKENEFSLKNGFRLLSSYNTNGGKIYIITENDRSATTLLLPSDY